jgi:hypothetical protein
VGFTALIAYASVHHPYYSVTKAFYGLGGLVPLCLLFADGFHVVDELAQRRAAFLRPALYGWICVLAACVFKAYLI